MAESTKNTDTSEPEEDLDYEVITAGSQLGEPAPLRKEFVRTRERKRNGKGAAVWMHEVTADDHELWRLSDRTLDEFGNVVKVKQTGSDARWVGMCARDKSGQNRVWATFEEAERELGRRGRYFLNQLVAAANRVNFGDDKTKTLDEAVADAEGNSE